ncbi:hypothetical protein ABPG72_007934 [Tetrahymena utriculariae]
MNISSQVFCNQIIQHSQPVSGQQIVSQLNIFALNNSCSTFEGTNQEQNTQLIYFSRQIIRRICDQLQNSKECYKYDDLIVLPIPYTFKFQYCVIIIGVMNLLLIIHIFEQACRQDLKIDILISEQQQNELEETDKEKQLKFQSVLNLSEYKVQISPSLLDEQRYH